MVVAEAINPEHLNIEFRRNLVGERWNRWLNLVERLMEVHLNDNDDLFKWRLMTSHNFTVKSMYLDLWNGNTAYLHKYLWKMKVPLKIKIFMWFLHRKEILTKDNLAKRNWQGSKKCCFCDHEETAQHLFIKCHFAKIIWSIIKMAFNIIPPTSISHVFGNWLDGAIKDEKTNIRVVVYVLLYGLYGMFGMILSLTNQFFRHFCKLSLWIPTGSIYGPFSSRRGSVRPWIFGATIW
jgi:hypothetical protein